MFDFKRIRQEHLDAYKRQLNEFTEIEIHAIFANLHNSYGSQAAINRALSREQVPADFIQSIAAMQVLAERHGPDYVMKTLGSPVPLESVRYTTN